MTNDTTSAWIVLAAALAFPLAGCSGNKGTPAAASLAEAPVARAIRTDLTNSVTLTAEFQPFFEVDVMAKESGYVQHMNVDLGDHVKKGQLLATIEIPELQDDLESAQASMHEAVSEIAVANGELRRARASNAISHLSYTRILEVSKEEKGLVPLQEVDVAHSHDLESEAQVFAAEQQVAAAQNKLQAANAESARQQALVAYTRILSPFDGVVTQRYASDGSLIQAGTASQTQAMPLVKVAENTVLRLMLPVPEENAGGIRDGQSVTVRVPSLKKSFAGKVTRFADSVQMATRTMTTEVDVPNPHLELISGMYAEVVLQIANVKNAVAVPLDAVDGAGANARVLVIGSEGRIHSRRVATGIQSPRYIQIVSGLAPGETVVTGRHSDYFDGQQVVAHLETEDTTSAQE